MRTPDRQPFRRPIPRPISRPPARSHRPAGPATIPPSVPESPGHRRELLKAAYHRLGRLAAVPVAQLVAADVDGLWAIVDGVSTVDNRQGKTRRLVMKVLRLRA